MGGNSPNGGVTRVKVRPNLISSMNILVHCDKVRDVETAIVLRKGEPVKVS